MKILVLEYLRTNTVSILGEGRFQLFKVTYSQMMTFFWPILFLFILISSVTLAISIVRIYFEVI